jgi:hypothetical protein
LAFEVAPAKQAIRHAEFLAIDNVAEHFFAAGGAHALGNRFDYKHS